MDSRLRGCHEIKKAASNVRHTRTSWLSAGIQEVLTVKDLPDGSPGSLARPEDDRFRDKFLRENDGHWNPREASLKDLFAMISDVQHRSSKRNITKKQLTEALDRYAHAVTFCDMHGLPYSSIRIELCGGYGFQRNFDAHATFLIYDGSTWSAHRERVGGKPSTRQMKYSLRAWVETDEEFKEKLLSLSGRKKPHQDLWEVDIPGASDMIYRSNLPHR